jgi:hypothetical protein
VQDADPTIVSVWQASIVSHRSSVYVSTPYVWNETDMTRHNLTVLGSGNNGVSFPRQLQLYSGLSGYSSLVRGHSKDRHVWCNGRDRPAVALWGAPGATKI